MAAAGGDGTVLQLRIEIDRRSGGHGVDSILGRLGSQLVNDSKRAVRELFGPECPMGIRQQGIEAMVPGPVRIVRCGPSALDGLPVSFQQIQVDARELL